MGCSSISSRSQAHFGIIFSEDRFTLFRIMSGACTSHRSPMLVARHRSPELTIPVAAFSGNFCEQWNSTAAGASPLSEPAAIYSGGLEAIPPASQE
jgi:hypothetical protein